MSAESNTASRLWMEIMPRGYHVWTTEPWLIDLYSNGGPDFSAVAQFDVTDGNRTWRLNPKYIIRCWLQETNSQLSGINQPEGKTRMNADGIRAAAERENEFHPKTSAGKPITAWDRRAATVETLVDEVNDLSSRVAELEARPVAPFPASG